MTVDAPPHNATAASHGEAHGAEAEPGFDVDLSGGMLFAFVCLVIGAALRGAKIVPLPYTVLLLLSGAIIALVEEVVP